MVKVISAYSLQGRMSQYRNEVDVPPILNYFIYGNTPKTIFCPNDDNLLQTIIENKFVITVGAYSADVRNAFYEQSNCNDLDFDNETARGFRITKTLQIDEWIELAVNLLFEVGAEVKIWYNIQLRPLVPWEEDYRLDTYRNILSRYFE
jgi:hypothetical protein